MTSRLAVALLLAIAVPALAADLDPKLAAKIKREQKKASDDVAKKHGDKKHSEMDPAERRALAKEQSEAQQEVLEKNAVTGKDYARYTAKLSRSDQKEMAGAEEALEAKEKADKAAAAAATAKKPDEGVKVQRGFSNEKPVEMEAKEGAMPVVEHGLPADEK
ncbi:MAG: hypothetical protein ACYC8T_03920 [Myxococcaceae bacterium]